MPRLLCALPLLGLMACADQDGPHPMNDLAGAFFDAPWPSDLRRGASGGPDLLSFPNADALPLLADYAALAEEVLSGASPVAPIFFRFDGALDLEVLPDPAGSLAEDATLFLINCDPDSPGWGERLPVTWDFQADETHFQPQNLLAVAPVPGAVLRPNTRYAVVITTAAAAADPDLTEVWTVDHPDHEYWRDLRLALFESGVPVEDVAIATRFTTGEPAEELSSLAWDVRTRLGVQDLQQTLTEVGTYFGYKAYEGLIWVPVWQQGERPYASEGGGFAREDDGEWAIASWERVHFSLTIPRGEPMPETGWPVVIYAHGTGGDWRSCCAGNTGWVEAEVAGTAGLAMLSISQPLHGDRATSSTNVELHTFNYFNPEAGRSNLRQGALDLVYLAHVLSGQPQVLTTAEGDELLLDPARLTFFGHSQGGITGAMALPYIGDLIRGAVLSGAGGGLSLTLVYRQQGGLDIAGLVTGALQFDSDEVLDPLHPVAAVVQSLTDATDPLNYSALWLSRRSPIGTPPVPVLMTEGLLDEHTPPITTEALGAAAGLPLIEPYARVPEVYSLLELGSTSTPSTYEQRAWDDAPITAGLAQFPDHDHFAVFNDRDAALLYQSFLRTATDGEPSLVWPD